MPTGRIELAESVCLFSVKNYLKVFYVKTKNKNLLIVVVDMTKSMVLSNIFDLHCETSTLLTSVFVKHRHQSQ